MSAMARNKRKLQLILLGGALVSVIYWLADLLGDIPNGAQDVPPFGWHWWITMSYWIAVAIYTLRSRCPQCNAPQIYRSTDPARWTWPDDTCWKCQANLGGQK